MYHTQIEPFVKSAAPAFLVKNLNFIVPCSLSAKIGVIRLTVMRTSQIFITIDLFHRVWLFLIFHVHEIDADCFTAPIVY